MLGKIGRGWMLEEKPPVTDQLPLVEVEGETRLTPRQQAVLQALKAAGWGGLRADEAGAIAHEMKEGRSQHGRDNRCDYCARDGRQILARLRDLGYARYRSKLKVWQANAALQARGAEPSDAPRRPAAPILMAGNGNGNLWIYAFGETGGEDVKFGFSADENLAERLAKVNKNKPQMPPMRAGWRSGTSEGRERHQVVLRGT